jgi:Animal haem peroxidase
MPPVPRIHGITPRGQARVIRSPVLEGRFGRMFELPAAPQYTEKQLNQLAETMREQRGDSGARRRRDAQPAGGDNPDIPSAYTYFGQFVDHDITFDASSRLQVQNDPDALVDFRTPRYDLDSLYGSGPVDEPFQYDQKTPGRVLLSDNGHGELDLPRNDQQIALIGDPRNDENVIVSGLQILMLRFHNKVAAEVDGDRTIRDEDRFDETRRRVRWHYQWVVLRDYLPRICTAELIAKLLRIEDGEPRYSLRFYRPIKHAYMPIEFSAAAFRFGHSQIRSAYRLNDKIGVKPIFVPGDNQPADADLRGGVTLLEGWTVDWTKFIPIAGSTAQPSRLIDAKLSPALFDLPRLPKDEPQSLALRNLLRGQSFGLPSGQDIAKAVGAPTVFSGKELGTKLDPTPLWFYILKEAELLAGGRTLGPTGARIVAEVLIGMLRTDPSSFLSQQPTWKPNPAYFGSADTFGLAELIEFARS